MFKPNYTITNQTAKHLETVAEARAIIKSAPLIPKWEVDLRRRALINSTFASTSIEDNPLTKDQVSDLMAGREVTARERDKQEVLNYFEALNQLDKLAVKDPSHKAILTLHEIITKDVLKNDQPSGEYRDGPVAVVKYENGQQVTVFQPPPASHVKQLMENFVEWLNSKEAQKTSTVIEAGIAHYELVRIHPFVDGNGRVARALASLVLVRRGFDTQRFFALDDFYNTDRKSYYDALATVDPQTWDLTNWLEYFTLGVATSINTVKDTILELTGGHERGKENGQLELNYQQVRVMQFLRQEGEVRNRDVRAILDVSAQRASKILQAMVENEIIVQRGDGRATHYVLAPEFKG